MEISFFEEFPTEENLEKLSLLPKSFGAKLYIVSHSFEEFINFEQKLNIPLVYWPVLKKSEGYWISPFTRRKALKRVLNEIEDKDIKLMLDLENPVHTKWLYIAELHNFKRNKKLIKKFIYNNGPKVTLVELAGNERKLKFWGLTYETNSACVAKMVYTSLRKPLSRKEIIVRLREVCEVGVKRHGKRFKIGLGCIAIGVGGSEPILSPDELFEDLKIAKDTGVSEAIIFRLGGMNEKYLESCNKVLEN